MFFKAAALIILAVSISQTTAQNAGVYRIINAASNTTLRSYTVGGVIFVRNTYEAPGPFEQWRINPNTEHITTITNVGLRADATAPPQLGSPVITDPIDSSLWSLSPAADNTFLIQVPNFDLVWNAEPPVVPYGPVALRLQNGALSQRWRLEAV